MKNEQKFQTSIFDSQAKTSKLSHCSSKGGPRAWTAPSAERHGTAFPGRASEECCPLLAGLGRHRHLRRFQNYVIDFTLAFSKSPTMKFTQQRHPLAWKARGSMVLPDFFNNTWHNPTLIIWNNPNEIHSLIYFLLNCNFN